MARRLYNRPALGEAVANGRKADLYTLDGVLVDDAQYLEQGMRLILTLDGALVLHAPAPDVGDEDGDGAAADGGGDGGGGDGGGDEGPRVVTVSFYIVNVKDVDAIEGVIDIDFQLYLSWTDPELAGVPVAERPPPVKILQRTFVD